MPTGSGRLETLAALGFLLLTGTLASEVLEGFGIPHLTGYLLAGILAGPQVGHLLDHETVERLAPVSTLALALIGFAGGAELRLELLRSGLRTLVVTTALQNVLGIVVCGGAFMVACRFLPFAVGEPWKVVLAMGLLWGVLATSRSPSAALGVLSQTRATGPLARYSLSFVMVSDVVVVVVMAAVLAVAKPLVDPTAELSFATFRALGHEFVGSVSVGTTLGLLLVAYFKFVGRHLVIVLIALGLGFSEVLRYLRLEVLLTFLTAGFVVQNLSKQGHAFLEALEEVGSIVFVVFFATAGAHLDVALLKQSWPIALALCTTRAVTAWGANRAGTAWAREEGAVRRWGFAPLVSQAGITLGLSATLATVFPTFGPGMRAVAVATVAINEMIGPILFKFALDRAGESQSASKEKRRQAGAEDAEVA
jgi:Kef-type K+ transport system membrane component KefB